MANLFNSIRVRPPKLNRFNLSHDVKLTCSFGTLVPILVQDCLPGDVFKNRCELLARFMPLKAPIMQEINIYTHFFFVPKRLVWDKWKEFITGGEDGNDTYPYPLLNIADAADSQFKSGSLADYLGFPVVNEDQTVHPSWNLHDGSFIDALPFRAYQLIYNEYYRDQNIANEIDIKRDVSGTYSSHSHMQLRRRAWRKDYFTSALPWAQRGDEVTLPLQGTADIVYNSGRQVIGQADSLNGAKINDDTPASSGAISSDSSGFLRDSKGNLIELIDRLSGTGGFVTADGSTMRNLIKGVDLSGASAATINELRRAIKAQEFLEVGARGGSRYIEQIYSYFGVRSSDARLQRPQFLGGGKSPVVISDVLQTSQSTESSPQATPAGHAVSVQNAHSFKFRCEEHGYIIGIMSIMPKASYQQGMPRMYSKFDRLDYYWPQFAHLGEQEILNKELYIDFSKPADSDVNKGVNNTFGYTPRYAEYKYRNDTVHGNFRDNLSFWHMGRIFNSPPALNQDFLTSMSGSVDRQFAVLDSNVHPIWVQLHHNLKALRKMPKYGTPMF
ncbi:major capsid protein [Dipodfec virus UOA04_Rod_1151]|nr:major capsid protein [Dipodfec virus UOA04_Rod_1151]